MTPATRNRVASVLYPLSGFGVLILLWHWVAASGKVPSFLLPAPTRVAQALYDTVVSGDIWPHLISTLQATVTGYALGAIIATALAALVAEFLTARRFLLPHLLALQSVPKVAVAPLVFLWFGFGFQGKIFLVTLICFFPVFVNALTGFRSAPEDLIHLMRASGASRWHIFCNVKLPSALSYIFSGLEIGVAFALIGCVIMEFLGARRGLGYVILDASNTFNLPLNFAAIMLLGLLGVAGNWLVRRARMRAVFWEPRADGNAGKGAGE